MFFDSGTPKELSHILQGRSNWDGRVVRSNWIAPLALHSSNIEGLTFYNYFSAAKGRNGGLRRGQGTGRVGSK